MIPNLPAVSSYTPPMIKHLVIAGGAHMGFSYYSALKTLIQKQFMSMDNIETIYTTSVGSCVAIFLLLQYDWETIDKYIIERPWNKVFKFDFPTLVQSITKGGIYDINSIRELFAPMLLGKDLSIDITLQEFYDYSNTELHFITTRFQDLGICDISHKTHPEWKLVEAVYATSCLPLLFVPFEKTVGDIYIDGAINMNYPINRCIEDGHDPTELLGVSYHFRKKEFQGVTSFTDRVEVNVQEKTTFKLFYFIMDLFFKLWYRIKVPMSYDSVNAPHQLNIMYHADPKNDIIQSLKSREKRMSLMDVGIHSANVFMDNEQQKQSQSSEPVKDDIFTESPTESNTNHDFTSS
jgi:predicted acylesterase/phospholipase RssA